MWQKITIAIHCSQHEFQLTIEAGGGATFLFTFRPQTFHNLPACFDYMITTLAPTWIDLASRLFPSSWTCWWYHQWCCRSCRWSLPTSHWRGTALCSCPSHHPTSPGPRWSHACPPLQGRNKVGRRRRQKDEANAEDREWVRKIDWQRNNVQSENKK